MGKPARNSIDAAWHRAVCPRCGRLVTVRHAHDGPDPPWIITEHNSVDDPPGYHGPCKGVGQTPRGRVMKEMRRG